MVSSRFGGMGPKGYTVSKRLLSVLDMSGFYAVSGGPWQEDEAEEEIAIGRGELPEDKAKRPGATPDKLQTARSRLYRQLR